MSPTRDIQWPGVPAPVLQGYGQAPPAYHTLFVWGGLGIALGGYLRHDRGLTAVGVGSLGYGLYRWAQTWRLLPW